MYDIYSRLCKIGMHVFGKIVDIFYIATAQNTFIYHMISWDNYVLIYNSIMS